MVAASFITPFFLENWNSAQVHLFVGYNVCIVFCQLWIGTAKKETFMEGKFCSLAWNFSRNKGLHFRHIRELTLLWVIWNSFHMTHEIVFCYPFSNNFKVGFLSHFSLSISHQENIFLIKTSRLVRIWKVGLSGPKWDLKPRPLNFVQTL